MRRLVQMTTGLMVAGTLMAADKVELKTEKEKLSYSVGMNVGRALKQQNLEVDLTLMSKAIQDVLDGKDTLLDEQEARQILVDYQRAAAQRKANATQQEGEAYLAANKKKEGVVTTESGLQYQIINKGTGPIPTAEDTVMVHYRGTLIDGTEFDNSYKRGPAAKFKVTGVIKGWTEALQLMPVGSKWKLTIPAELAYGARGRPNIPGNSVLLFDVELVGIEEKKEEPAK